MTTRRIIDHDEDDRDSSEYEEIDEDEEVYDNVYHQEVPTTSGIVIEQDIGGESVEEVYYDNEMEDLVIHEIYGDQQPQKSRGQISKRNVPAAAAYLNVVCIVCNRLESDKIRLFRWPKNDDLRQQWIHFFHLPENLIALNPEPYICSFHFTADTFMMIDDRIFWKASALPKYHSRRPCLTEPFPWEPAARQKIDDEKARAADRAANQPEYRIRYRMPYNKHRSKNSHPVAVLTPVDPSQSHLFYEFHFNRNGLDSTKFYACLNCRKSKSETGIRDVIRTIHLQNNKLFSPGDPFAGHHFACRPHSIYDYSSSRGSWRQNSSVPSTSSATAPFSDVVYLDEQGNTIEWTNNQGEDGGELMERVEKHKPNCEIYEPQPQPHPQPVQNIIQESIIIQEEVEDDYGIPPILEEDVEDEQIIELTLKSSKPKTKLLKCHLCISKQRTFRSTEKYVAHLQSHLKNRKKCGKCQKLISCDSAPIFHRRKMCLRCFKSSN